MASERLDELLGSTTAKAPSTTACSQALALLRECRLPRPGLVLQLGETAMSRLSASTQEYWDVAAQICAAAADVGEFEIMETMLDRILRRFPASPRALALLGLSYEAKSRWKDAMQGYMDVVKQQPMAPAIYMRQVAVLKSTMKVPEAVAMLNHYLSLYPGDQDGWAELCALCLSLGRLSHALFAAHELILNNPHNFAYQALVADVYMTCGGQKNVARAREHYAASLVARKRGNLKALYGMWLACSMLMDNDLLKEESDITRNQELLAAAQAGIKAIYAKLREDSGHAASPDAACAVMEINVVTGKKRISPATP